LKGDKPNAAGGKKTTRGAPAAQYGDVVKYRALAIDVEYRSALGQPDSGLVKSSAPAVRFARLLRGRFEPLSSLVVCCGSGQGQKNTSSLHSHLPKFTSKAGSQRVLNPSRANDVTSRASCTELARRNVHWLAMHCRFCISRDGDFGPLDWLVFSHASAST